jgi:hypothetical protein
LGRTDPSAPGGAVSHGLSEGSCRAALRGVQVALRAVTTTTAVTELVGWVSSQVELPRAGAAQNVRPLVLVIARLEYEPHRQVGGGQNAWRVEYGKRHDSISWLAPGGSLVASQAGRGDRITGPFAGRPVKRKKRISY